MWIEPRVKPEDDGKQIYCVRSVTKATTVGYGVDNEFIYGSSSSSYEIVNDTFKINLQKGATYSFISESYFDPYNIVVYDSMGTPLVGNSEGNDLEYGDDSIFDYIATYTGTHYISANWDHGLASGHQYLYFFAWEDVDTIPAITNHTPIITSGSTATIAENAAISTVLYTATATDIDANTTLVYSLSGTDVALLNINSSNGQVTLKAPADYETKSSYGFNVIASDGVLVATKAVTASVTDVYEVMAFSDILNPTGISSLTSSQMGTSKLLSFESYPNNTSGFENKADFLYLFPGDPFYSMFKVSLQKGATYSISSAVAHSDTNLRYRLLLVLIS